MADASIPQPEPLPRPARFQFRRWRLGFESPCSPDDLAVLARLEADSYHDAAEKHDLTRLWQELAGQFGPCEACQCRWSRLHRLGCSLAWHVFVNAVVRAARLYRDEARRDMKPRERAAEAARKAADCARHLGAALEDLERQCQQAGTAFPGLNTAFRLEVWDGRYNDLEPTWGKNGFPAPYYGDLYQLLAALEAEAGDFAAGVGADAPLRASPRVFMESLATECAANRNAGMLPPGFCLSYDAWAALAAAALKLEKPFPGASLHGPSYQFLRDRALVLPAGRPKRST